MAREADDPRLRAEEARLARLAADGDGAAFATLYDRYEQRIYTFCHRLVGSEHDAADATQDAFVKVLQRLPRLGDRELNFGAYLFTAARNASYDVIGKRKKADTVDEIPEHGSQPVYGEMGDRLDLDPEGAAMLGALQDQVKAANARLPERQREVLALRELEELSYDEIAEMMGMNRNSVAQLISRARIKLRDELRGSALASVAAATPDDERAAALIAERMDGELTDDEDRAWLEDYLRDNERGRAMVECMLEAGTSYRAWLPIVPAIWLRDAAIAKAAESVGADWSAHATGGHGAADGSAGGAAGSPGDAADPGGDPDGSSAGAERTGSSAGAHTGRRRRAAVGGAIAGVILLLVLGSQLVLGGGDQPETAAVVTAATTTADPTVSTATGGAEADVETTSTTSKSKKKTKKKTSSGDGDGDGATDAQAQVTTAADGTTTVVRNLQQPSGGQTKTTSKKPSSKKQQSSDSKGTNVESSGGSGSGKQGEGSAPLPADPQPAPQPAPEPEPQPQPEPQPPPETTPAPTTPAPTTPTRPCRPGSTVRPC